MEATRYIELVTDPKAWLTKAAALRRSGDAVWNDCIELMDDRVKKFNHLSEKEFKERNKTAEEQDLIAAHALILMNAQLLYSLAIECALKGLIVMKDPKSITISTTMDGKGELIAAELKQFGKRAIESHNLEKLAEIANVFGDEAAEHREFLYYCSQIITWLGRYPVPLSSEKGFIFRGVLSAEAFSFKFKDYSDPLLDWFFDELKKAFNNEDG